MIKEKSHVPLEGRLINLKTGLKLYFDRECGGVFEAEHSLGEEGDKSEAEKDGCPVGKDHKPEPQEDIDLKHSEAVIRKLRLTKS